MALFNIKASLDAIASHMASDGGFATVQLGEPTAPPQGNGLFASVYMRSVNVTKVYLDGGTEELHLVNIRIMRNMLAEPTGEIELELAQAVQRVVADIIGKFQLGGEVREVDYGGINGTPLSTEWGTVFISDAGFRVADIALPLTVDDSAKGDPS